DALSQNGAKSSVSVGSVIACRQAGDAVAGCDLSEELPALDRDGAQSKMGCSPVTIDKSCCHGSKSRLWIGRIAPSPPGVPNWGRNSRIWLVRVPDLAETLLPLAGINNNEVSGSDCTRLPSASENQGYDRFRQDVPRPRWFYAGRASGNHSHH